MIWLLSIAVNLISQRTFFDLAVRGVEISLGAFALAKLTEVREQVTAASTLEEKDKAPGVRAIA